jgi:hypothetical protein
VNAYDAGSDIDAALTKTACARLCPKYVQLSRRTSAHPDGALIDDVAERRAEMAASSTSPVATFVGRPTVSDDADVVVTDVEAERNVGEDPVPELGPGLPNDVAAVPANAANTASAQPTSRVSRDLARMVDRMVSVPPFGPWGGRVDPTSSVGWASQRSASR